MHNLQALKDQPSIFGGHLLWKKHHSTVFPRKIWVGTVSVELQHPIHLSLSTKKNWLAAETQKKRYHRTSAHLVTHIEVASNTSNREHHQLERCRNSCLGKITKGHWNPAWLNKKTEFPYICLGHLHGLSHFGNDLLEKRQVISFFGGHPEVPKIFGCAYGRIRPVRSNQVLGNSITPWSIELFLTKWLKLNICIERPTKKRWSPFSPLFFFPGTMNHHMSSAFSHGVTHAQIPQGPRLHKQLLRGHSEGICREAAQHLSWPWDEGIIRGTIRPPPEQ